jgi:hypothetical protein
MKGFIKERRIRRFLLPGHFIRGAGVSQRRGRVVCLVKQRVENAEAGDELAVNLRVRNRMVFADVQHDPGALEFLRDLR